MEGGLTITPLRYTLRAEEPLALDAQPGSALRGAIFHALLRRFCTMPHMQQCSDCPIVASCPVAALVAPLRDEQPGRGQNIPRPFVLRPPLRAAQSNGLQLQVDETVSFGLLLIGKAAGYFPYLALSAQTLAQAGLGRPLRENGGRRGRCTIAAIDVLAADGAPQRLYTAGERVAQAPSLTISAADISTRAATLPTDRLILHFLTPTRLIADGKLVPRPEPQVMLCRLAERLDALEREYAEGVTATAGPGRWYAVAQHATLALAQWDGQWIEARSHSSRTQRATPISGFVGRAIITGDLTLDVRTLLAWGEALHVGKDTVKGDGWYQIVL